MIGGAFTNAFWEVLGLRDLTHLHPFFAGVIVSFYDFLNVILFFI